MISNRKLATIKSQARMSQREKQQIQVEDNYKQEDGEKGVHNMFQTIWIGV